MSTVSKAAEKVDWEDNGLPVLSLEISPEEFAKVNESPDHSNRASDASISIKVPDEIGNAVTVELDYISGRGHGTWAADKKAYRFKLKESTDLFGMGTNKNWVLLANRYDATLLRNRIISYIGEQMGMAYTPESVPVDLVVNGEYYGSYVLCEQIRVGKSRIDIDELGQEDIEEPEVTGGYLLCLNPDYEEAAENVFLTDHMVRFGNEEPQFSEGESGVAEQKEYISAYIQKTENAIFSDNVQDAAGLTWSDYMDMGSAADYWWVQEFSGNHDAFITSSTYLYKERSGKLFWGPLWDFDLSLGGSLDATDGFLHRNMIWLDHLRASDKNYQELLYDRWELLDQVIEDLLREDGVIDRYAEEIRKSWEDDQRRWPIIDENGETVHQDFDEEVEKLKTWIRLRRAWINENIDKELCHVYNTVTFMVNSEVYRREKVLVESTMNRLPEAPYQEGSIFSHWAFEQGNPYEYDQIDHDIELHAVYPPRQEAGITEGIYFANPKDAWVSLRSKKYEPVYELLPYDTIDKNIQWKSSDTSLAEIDEYGTITLKGTGDVKIEASLCTGAKNSFALHIYDLSVDKSMMIENIMVEENYIHLKEDEYDQIIVRVDPPLCDSDPQFDSDDENVAVVDAFGVVHALHKGTANITVKDSRDADLSACVQIIVE